MGKPTVTEDGKVLVGNWVLIGAGLLAILGSYFMVANADFRGWILRNGRGRFWVRILGERRAHTATRLVFGPITLLFGIVLIAAGAFGGPLGR